jgi:hypothetical protein
VAARPGHAATRPVERKAEVRPGSGDGPLSGSHAGSHRDEQPRGSPDSNGQRVATRPRSRTDLNRSGRPHMELPIRCFAHAEVSLSTRLLALSDNAALTLTSAFTRRDDGPWSS